MPVPTTRLSFLASDGTLLRLFSLNIACLREAKFWTIVGSIQTKDSLRDKIAFCLLPSIDIHSFGRPFAAVEALIINPKGPNITQHSKRSTIAPTRSVKMDDEYKESGGHLSDPHPAPGHYPPAVVSGMF